MGGRERKTCKTSFTKIMTFGRLLIYSPVIKEGPQKFSCPYQFSISLEVLSSGAPDVFFPYSGFEGMWSQQASLRCLCFPLSIPHQALQLRGLRIVDTQYPPPESPASSRSLHPGFPCSGSSRPPPGTCRPGMSGAMPTAFPSLAALSAGKREKTCEGLYGKKPSKAAGEVKSQAKKDLHAPTKGAPLTRTNPSKWSLSQPSVRFYNLMKKLPSHFP